MEISDKIREIANTYQNVGLFLGKKFKAGKWTDELCLSFHVREKKPISELSEDEIIPNEIDGIKTDVVQSNPKPAMNPRQQYLALQPGLSVGPEGLDQAGTLGPMVIDNNTGKLLCMTSWHVVTPIGVLTEPADYLVHPAVSDTGGDRVGKLFNSILDFQGDAALYTPSVPAACAVIDMHQIIASVARAQIDDLVEKVGRSTDITYGKVSGSGTVYVDYSDWGIGTMSMSGFSVIPSGDDVNEEIVAEGDSGSLVYIAGDDDFSAVGLGLVVSMSSEPTIMYCCHLNTLMSSLNVSLPDYSQGKLEQIASTNVGVPKGGEIRGSVQVIGNPGKSLSMALTAMKDQSVTYTTADQLAVAQGATDAQTLAEDAGFDDFTAYVQSKGHRTVAHFLANKSVKSVSDILAENGITYTDA